MASYAFHHLFLLRRRPPLRRGHRAYENISSILRCSASLRPPFSTVCVWVKHPVDGLEYEVHVSHAWTCTPQHQGLVPVTHVPDVLGLILVNRRVRISKS